MPMNNGSPMDNPLIEAAEKIRREGYQAGWRDAVAALNKAAAEAADMSPSEAAPEADYVVSKGLTAQGGPTQGSTPYYVLQAIKKRPGMTGSEIVSVVQGDGHKVSDGSIRTSMARLRDRKLAVSRHGKWFSA
jgi:hypothetical protein